MRGNHTDQIYSRGKWSWNFEAKGKEGETQIEEAGKYNNVRLM